MKYLLKLLVGIKDKTLNYFECIIFINIDIFNRVTLIFNIQFIFLIYKTIIKYILLYIIIIIT